MDVLSRAIRQKKEVKGMDTNWKGISQNSTICRLTRKLLQLISKFSKVSRLKLTQSTERINMLKKLGYLHSIIVTNNIEYLGVTTTNEVKDLYDKNFKSLKKETEEDLGR